MPRSALEKRIGAAELEAAAEELERQAQALRDAAGRSYQDAHRTAARERWQAARREAAQILFAHGDGPEGRALALDALRRGISDEIEDRAGRAAWALGEALKNNTRLARALRDREIMKLYRQGRTNAEIAGKIGLSTAQVGKIIARAKRL